MQLPKDFSKEYKVVCIFHADGLQGGSLCHGRIQRVIGAHDPSIRISFDPQMWDLFVKCGIFQKLTLHLHL